MLSEWLKYTCSSPAWQASEGEGKRKDERVKRKKVGRDREAEGRFEITSTITPWIVRPAMQAKIYSSYVSYHQKK